MELDHDDGRLFDPWTRDYALLGLRLDRLAPGTVDAWIGPPSWREAVATEPLPTPQELRAAAESLLDRLSGMGYETRREAYLLSQVTALRSVVRVLEGETLRLAEHAELLFDVRPERVPESTFEAAHRKMDGFLPGAGSLADRALAWRHSFDVPVDRLLPLLRRVEAEVRARTTRHVQLPKGEAVEIVLVRDQPWRAYNWYLGNARSRIEVNTDLPIQAVTLPSYLAHEGYPGHHTEHALREMRQYRAGQGEYAIQLINTPESVISEAIATCAGRLIFPDAEDLEWLAADVLPDLDMGVDPERAAGLRAASEDLSGVSGNAAFLLHEDGLPPSEVAAYLQYWSLSTAEEAAHFLEFLQSPLWKAYTFTYTYGKKLLEPLLEGPDRFAVFQRILTEPVYPSLLRTLPGPAPVETGQ